MAHSDRQKGDTWPQILRYNYKKYGSKSKAMRYKHHGIWLPFTWEDYYHDVKRLALGLLSLGFKFGDKMVIVGDNAPQWYISELAAQANHGVSVGAYSDLSPSELEYLVQHSEARFAVVEGQEQIDKFLEIRDNLPLLEKVIFWDYKGLAHYDDPILLGYRQVQELGEKYEKAHEGQFEQNLGTGQADEICAFVYSPGTTTSAPKGVKHTYRSTMAGADYLLSLNPWREDDNILPSLPPVWITEQWLQIGCHLLSACTLNFAESPETQLRDTRETEPSVIFYGAWIWESQAATIHARMLRANAFNRYVFLRLLPIGYRMAENRLQNENSGLFLKTLNFFASLVLFKPLKKNLGLSNARICYTTGTALSPDALNFYHALNIPLKNIYATTEGGVLCGVDGDVNRLETGGAANEETEVRITETSEIILRQPSICAGYHNDPDQIDAMLRDGWLYSGDSGFINEAGQVGFIDSMDSLLELPNGEKLSFQLIESRLRFSPFIKEAWAFSDASKPHVSVIIVIDYLNVSRWAGQRKINFNNFAELSQQKEIYGLVEQEINRVNSDLPSGGGIKKFVNLHREFDPYGAEVTHTRKLRRQYLKDRYQNIIDSIYSDKTEVAVDDQVQVHDGQPEMTKTTLRIKSIEGVAR